MFCENCGKKLDAGARFCEGCGESAHTADSQIAAGAAESRVVDHAAEIDKTVANPIADFDKTTYDFAPSPADVAAYPGKSKKPPVIAIVACAACIIALCAGLFLYFSSRDAEDDEPIIGATAEVEETFGDGATGGGDTTDGNGGGSYDIVMGEDGYYDFVYVEEASEQDETSSPSTPEQSETTPEPQSGFSDYKGYADGKETSIGDFFWYTEDVKWDGLPTDRTAITEFDAISGYWKSYTEYLRTHLGEAIPEDVESTEWFNIEISGDAEGAVFTYHTSGFSGLEYRQQELVEYDVSFRDGDSERGSFNDGRLAAGDMNTRGVKIVINEFYTSNGKQYAVGEISYISGEKGNIALVRP